jgi:hypothetical protein
LNDFANDTDADLAAYVQMYRSRIADMTDEIKAKVRGRMDEVMREAIETVKLKLEEDRERLEQIKDEQKRRAATSKG